MKENLESPNIMYSTSKDVGGDCLGDSFVTITPTPIKNPEVLV